MKKTNLWMAVLVTCSFGCGAVELGPALEPVHATAESVAACVQACAGKPDIGHALRQSAECAAPSVLRAAGAWCNAGLVKGPFCTALGGIPW